MDGATLHIVGNLVDVPQIVGEDTKLRAKFRVITSYRRRTEDGWIDDGEYAVDVVCWRRLAESARYSLKKGTSVIIEGKLRTRSYEVDGQRRYHTECEAHTLGVDLGRGLATFTRWNGGDQAAVRNDAIHGDRPGRSPGDADDDRPRREPGDADDDRPRREPGDADDDQGSASASTHTASASADDPWVSLQAVAGGSAAAF